MYLQYVCYLNPVKTHNVNIVTEWRIKPIFHCNTKPLVLAPRIGLDTQHVEFVLPIPTCWYLKSLADTVGPPNTSQYCLTWINNAQREPIMTNASPNTSKWNTACASWVCAGHVHFMLLMSISYVWNIGFEFKAITHQQT